VSFKTKNTGIAGLSAAGTVTSVNGSNSQFAVNDTVFITGSGLWAEEVTVSQSAAAVVHVNRFILPICANFLSLICSN
jgi:NADPH:quinone reductase-like Zn-dependent oxidoreductase